MKKAAQEKRFKGINESHGGVARMKKEAKSLKCKGYFKKGRAPSHARSS